MMGVPPRMACWQSTAQLAAFCSRSSSHCVFFGQRCGPTISLSSAPWPTTLAQVLAGQADRGAATSLLELDPTTLVDGR